MVLRWFNYFHSCLVNKASLYFYDVLNVQFSRKSLAQDLRRLEVNFVAMYETSLILCNLHDQPSIITHIVSNAE